MCLDNPETISLTGQWKRCLLRNQSLEPKRLGIVVDNSEQCNEISHHPAPPDLGLAAGGSAAPGPPSQCRAGAPRTGGGLPAGPAPRAPLLQPQAFSRPRSRKPTAQMRVSGLASPTSLAAGTRGPLAPLGCGGPRRRQPGRGAGDGSACSPSTQNKGARGTYLPGHPPSSLTGQPTELEPKGGPASQGVATPATHLTPQKCQPQDPTPQWVSQASVGAGV